MAKEGKKPNTVRICTDLAAPVAEGLGLVIWDVRFEKEGGSHFLRYFVDRQEGGVTIEDCENFSRAIDPILDEADPIAGGYYLEVSSPGTERTLKTPRHYEAFVGKKIVVKVYQPIDGRREFTGTLTAFEAGEPEAAVALATDEGETLRFTLSQIATAKQFAEYNYRGA